MYLFLELNSSHIYVNNCLYYLYVSYYWHDLHTLINYKKNISIVLNVRVLVLVGFVYSQKN